MHAPQTFLSRLQAGIANWLYAPASARPLAFFRIGLATVLLAQALAIASSVPILYGSRGIVQWWVSDVHVSPGIPRISWVVDVLAPFGVTEAWAVRGVFGVYVLSLAGLLVGWQTRMTAILAWLTHLALNMSGNVSIYGVDQLAHIALFYCVVMPVGAALSADRTALGRPETATSGARLSLRVLQLHLCVVYLAGGLEKIVGEQWRNGEAIWRTLVRPDVCPIDFHWLADYIWLAQLMCWGTLVLEIGYPLMMWSRWTRLPWALAIISMHVGIAVTLGLWSFSCVMIVLTGSAFLVSAMPVAGRVASAESEQTSRAEAVAA